MFGLVDYPLYQNTPWGFSKGWLASSRTTVVDPPCMSNDKQPQGSTRYCGQTMIHFVRMTVQIYSPDLCLHCINSPHRQLQLEYIFGSKAEYHRGNTKEGFVLFFFLPLLLKFGDATTTNHRP